MIRLFTNSAKIRRLSSRLGSLLLLFQRSPIIQMLFPEARVLGSAGLGEAMKWTAATIAGLGAYDTVAGATTVSQFTPNATAGSTNITTAVGSNLSFFFLLTGTSYSPSSWQVNGIIPPGLVQTKTNNILLNTISGVATSEGSYTIGLKAWENTNGTGNSFPSGANIYKNFTITVGPAIITTHPPSVAISSGGTTTLSVVASGSPLAYQWYLGNSGDIAQPVGTNSASFTTPALNASTKYWVKVTRGTLTVTTNPVAANSTTATVSIGVIPAIITQPSATTTINNGGTTTLTVAASGTPAPTYQWYIGNSPDTTTLATGASATTASYTTPALNSSTSYWVRATNASGSASSNTAAITVNQPAVITTQPPATTTLNSGSTTTLTVVASGTGPFTYQWYQGRNGDVTTPVGTNSASFTTPTLSADTSYWVKVTNSANSSGALSNTAAITVNQPAVITTQPAATTTLNSGSTTTLTVVASGTGPFTYQWYQGRSGDVTTPVGTNSASFTTPTLSADTSYWVKVTNSANSSGALSNTAAITVNGTFASWQASQFSPTQLSDPLISGATADPDGDGISNENEYILGLSPLAGNPSPSPTISRSVNQLALSFTATAASGSGYAGKIRHYSLETADSLSAWTAVPSYEDIPATGQSVSYSTTLAAARKFYHLRVWLTP